MAAIDQLNSLAGLLQTVQGTETKTKTKSSQTQQTQISDQGVNKLIQDILAGPGGVRSIGGAARSTGLFNSTTEDMLLGDLFSRAAVSAELARSPTVVNTTGSQVTETPGIGGGGLGTVLLAGQAGKALFGEGGQGGLLSGAGEAISSFFGGGAGAAASAAAPAAASTAGGALAGATGSAVVNAGVAGTAGGALASGASGAGSGAAAAGGASAAGGLGFNAATAIPLGGSFLGGLLGGREASQDPAGLAVSALAGAAALGPVGLIAAPLAALAGGFLSDLSVVCTALHRKGLITKHLHKGGEHYFSTVPSVTKVGYWLWGVPVARKIDAGSVGWTRFTLPVVKSYLRFVAGPRTLLSCFDHPLGGLAYYLGEPICKALGHAVLYWETKVKRYN